jgi:hypothetical protein
VVHGIVAGVVGETEANGLWILTPLDPNTFSLSTLSPQGTPMASVGTNAYVSGGTISTAFPDYSILLGRRNLALATGVTSPRVVFVPTAGRAWDFESYAGAGPDLVPAVFPNVRGSLQQQSMTTAPQVGTEFTTFDVWVHGSAPDYGADAPSPDYGDFDATQALVFALVNVMFAQAGGGFRILREDWPSQTVDAGSMTQRGQTWHGVLEVAQGAAMVPAQFVPIGVSAEIVVEPINPGNTDPVVIDI